MVTCYFYFQIHVVCTDYLRSMTLHAHYLTGLPLRLTMSQNISRILFLFDQRRTIFFLETNDPCSSTKHGELVDQLSDHWLLKDYVVFTFVVCIYSRDETAQFKPTKLQAKALELNNIIRKHVINASLWQQCNTATMI